MSIVHDRALQALEDLTTCMQQMTYPVLGLEHEQPITMQANQLLRHIELLIKTHKRDEDIRLALEKPPVVEG